LIFGARLDVRWLVVGFVGASALALPALARVRLDPTRLRSPRHFVVTNDADGGPGSLREAIAAANHADGTAHIRLPPIRIELKTPLPPIVNEHGVSIAGVPGSAIDGSAVVTGALLELLAPRSRLSGFTVEGAAGDGIRVHSAEVELESLAILRCDTGVRLLAGAHGTDVTQSRFERNGVGIALERGAIPSNVRTSAFLEHRRAAIWAVSSEPAAGGGLSVRHNRFANDAIAVLAWNVPADVVDNDVAGAREAGLFIAGRDNVLQGNRVRGGQRYGICVVAADASTISGNETDGNRAAGVFVRDTMNTVVRDNRVYDNGFGILVLFGDARWPTTFASNAVWNQRLDGLYVIGSSPVLSTNDVRVNGGAGLRIDDFLDARGRERRADPLLRDNTFDRNGSDEPARGQYVEPRVAEDHGLSGR
jgi:parallel beta-helix repeat protein